MRKFNTSLKLRHIITKFSNKSMWYRYCTLLVKASSTCGQKYMICILVLGKRFICLEVDVSKIRTEIKQSFFLKKVSFETCRGSALYNKISDSVIYWTHFKRQHSALIFQYTNLDDPGRSSCQRHLLNGLTYSRNGLAHLYGEP